MNVGLQVLRAKIKGFHIAGEKLHRRIAKASGKRRHALWGAKRQLGRYARLHLIAYGLIRGIPYDRIERCGEHNGPDQRKLLALLQEHDHLRGSAHWNALTLRETLGVAK